MHIQANIIDIPARRIFFGSIEIKDSKIVSIREVEGDSPYYLLPGFVDAHIHIESSMLVPSEFARMALPHGTLATVSDPHEIANVLGLEGVEFMIENGKQVPLKFHFGAPSCVPATSFETAGAVLDVDAVQQLLNRKEVLYLAEMMNYPGVLHQDPEVLAKIAAAKKVGKPIDGHAPGLRGEAARRYIEAGISTDHECFSYEEGLEKLEAGMKVLIREGSAAKNFDALINLLPLYPDHIMFCSDDKHPDDLIQSHINGLVQRAVAQGCDLFEVLQAACINPVQHYGLGLGQLRPGDSADFILVEDLVDFQVKESYIDGQLVAKDGSALVDSVPIEILNNFEAKPVKPAQFQAPAAGDQIRVIQAIDGELITKSYKAKAVIKNGVVQPDMENDVLKIAVVNRYQAADPAVAFINGFGLQHGAIASCVGHDSHNILVVGADDHSISRAVNLIVEQKGGIAAVGQTQELVLPLPVAGIMSATDGHTVARAYSEIDQFAKESLGSSLSAPFMTLSFMALLVIPELKLSDQGLFDGQSFSFVPLFS